MSLESDPAHNETKEGSSPPSTNRKRNLVLWPVLAAAVCMLAGAGFLLSQRSGAGSPTGGKGKGGRGGGAIPVAVDTVKQGDLGVYINALGTVTPVYTVNITSRVVGQLMEVNYREGQIVRKGQLLAVIDPRPYLATFEQAQGQLERDQAMLRNARIDLTRYQTAFEEHAVPEQQVATQQATVSQDEGTVKVDQGSLDAAKVNLEYTRIAAPIDGRIGLRAVDPGNIVQAGTQTLLSITQLQPITVIFTVAEDYIDEIAKEMRRGRKLPVDALDRDNQTTLANGSLLTVDNQIDITTGTVRVRATFANRDYVLFPNEFVNAHLLVKTLHNVNLVNTAAIQRNNEQAFVYVVNPSAKTVQSRNVKVATTDGNIAAVTGVNPGETLVTDGFDKLEDGTRIAIRREGGNGPSQPSAEERTGPGAQPGEQGNASSQVNTNQQNPQQPQTPPPPSNSRK